MSLFTVHTGTFTRPDAAVDSDDVELTPEQVSPVTRRGLLESISSDAAAREFGIDAVEAFRWSTQEGTEADYVIGGQGTGFTMTRSGAAVEAGPLYVASRPQKHMGDNSTDNITVMLTTGR